MSKNKVLAEKEVEEVEEVVVKDSSEKARRKRIVEAYKKGNPVKADKMLLSKDGKTLISLDQWVNEA